MEPPGCWSNPSIIARHSPSWRGVCRNGIPVSDEGSSAPLPLLKSAVRSFSSSRCVGEFPEPRIFDPAALDAIPAAACGSEALAAANNAGRTVGRHDVGSGPIRRDARVLDHLHGRQAIGVPPRRFIVRGAAIGRASGFRPCSHGRRRRTRPGRPAGSAECCRQSRDRFLRPYRPRASGKPDPSTGEKLPAGNLLADRRDR
jgi:hypothetical protein